MKSMILTVLVLVLTACQSNAPKPEKYDACEAVVSEFANKGDKLYNEQLAECLSDPEYLTPAWEEEQ